MGKIEGDLPVIGVSNLLQTLSEGGVRGYLTVSQDGQSKVIEFHDRGIRLVSGIRRSTPLGEILLRSGKITRDELDELLAEQRRVRRPLGEMVAERGLLSAQVIDGALREQAAEEICDLFTWNRATFRFVDAAAGPAPPDTSPLSSVVLEMNMMSILLEAARRVDELERIQCVFPDARLVPSRLELPTGLDDAGLERGAIEDVLPLVDGERSVGQIVDDSLYPKFTVLRTLYGLVRRGCIKVRDHANPEGPITVFQRAVAAPADTQALAGGTVLVLSETPTFRNAVALTLRRAGLEVREAETWDEAARAGRRDGVKAIVLDTAIDTDEGFERCHRLREAASAPFVVLAGTASRRAVRNALVSGASYVLLKPIKEDLLLERIQTVVQEVTPASS